MRVAEFIPFWSESWGDKEGTSNELEENLQRLIFRAYLTTDVDFQFKLIEKKNGKKHSRKLWYLP